LQPLGSIKIRARYQKDQGFKELELSIPSLNPHGGKRDCRISYHQWQMM
jgi:hypothetical protein